MTLEQNSTQLCAKCVYPSNARPTIIFDENGVCSGCIYHESRSKVDWGKRYDALIELLGHYKSLAKKNGNPYDCLVGVSGGKDSTYQVYLLRQLGMNPLLVMYNHTFNTEIGLRNLRNLVKKSGCNLVQYTTSPEAIRRLSRHMLMTVGDLTWPYHAGCLTWPMKAAALYNIPLVVWGEEGFAELTGMFRLDNEVEYTNWKRIEHDMRGYEGVDLIGKGDPGFEIQPSDVECYTYPSDEVVSRLGLRGIYLSNYIDWDAEEQARIVREEWGFEFAETRQRTFLTYTKLDDHANDVHDYLKYLKFGYGRATDDVSTEIRHDRMSRELGLEVVHLLDRVRPEELNAYLQWLEIDRDEMLKVLGGIADGGYESVMERWREGDRKTPDTKERRLLKEELHSHKPYWTSYVGVGGLQHGRNWTMM